MKRFKKSIVVPISLAIYTAIIAILFYPKHPESEKPEMLAIIAICYVVIVILWFVLRRKEKITETNKSTFDEDNAKK
ncbi:MAG: hypothetical protein PHX49_10735 [Bacteroidales bacterium]|jgi:H+/gluconate symporter-like permease|nr:hypothetical protein [Bacteroidales bacterium]